MNTNTTPLPLGGSPYVGLTDAECFALARTASHLPGAWYVQRDEDDQGHASVGLVPDDGGTDDSIPVFLLWREDGPLRLGCGQGELYADLGIQIDVQAAIEAIRRILEGVIQVGQWVGGETHALTPCAELRLGWLRRSDVG